MSPSQKKMSAPSLSSICPSKMGTSTLPLLKKKPKSKRSALRLMNFQSTNQSQPQQPTPSQSTTEKSAFAIAIAVISKKRTMEKVPVMMEKARKPNGLRPSADTRMTTIAGHKVVISQKVTTVPTATTDVMATWKMPPSETKKVVAPNGSI